jgi:hypothetical protein
LFVVKLCLAFWLYNILTLDNRLQCLNSIMHVAFWFLEVTAISTGFPVRSRTFAQDCVQGSAVRGHLTNAPPSAPLFNQSMGYCYVLLPYTDTFQVVPVHFTKPTRVAPGRGPEFQNAFEPRVQVWCLWCPCSMALSKALDK